LYASTPEVNQSNSRKMKCFELLAISLKANKIWWSRFAQALNFFWKIADGSFFVKPSESVYILRDGFVMQTSFDIKR